MKVSAQTDHGTAPSSHCVWALKGPGQQQGATIMRDLSILTDLFKTQHKY